MHKQAHESEEGAHRRSHLFIMALCCLIPIALVAVIVYANVESQYLPFLLLLLCPLSMLLMYLSETLFRKKRTEDAHH